MNHRQACKVAMIAALMLSLIVLPGCAEKTVRASAEGIAVTPVPMQLRFETEESPFPEYASLEAAAPEVGIKLKTPKVKVGSLKKVVVRDERAGEPLPKNLRSVDIHYSDVVIIQYPYADEAEAELNFSWFPSQLDKHYYSEATVNGLAGWRRDAVNEPLTENADGSYTRGVSLPGNTLLWRDGRMLYNMSSDTIPSAELVTIAESMY